MSACIPKPMPSEIFTPERLTFVDEPLATMPLLALLPPPTTSKLANQHVARLRP